MALRRTLRIETLASSPFCLACLTNSRRRSSVSCGIEIRRISPLLVGFTPRSELRIAVSIGPSCACSYGFTTTIRGSGTVILDIWVIGVGDP